MSAAFTALFAFLKDILTWCLDGILWLVSKVLYLFFDGVLSVVSLFFHSLDFSTILSSSTLDWAGLPTQMIWFINAVGIPQGIAMLISAIAVRQLLNLIPAFISRI